MKEKNKLKIAVATHKKFQMPTQAGYFPLHVGKSRHTQKLSEYVGDDTGDNISEENIERIWKRFYKADQSRNRSQGGTGIGLAFVKAIMTNYNMKYGVINCDNGVEFYFELKLGNDIC